MGDVPGGPDGRTSIWDPAMNTLSQVLVGLVISSAVVSEEVVDIFNAVGLERPNIGILDDAFLAEVRNLPDPYGGVLGRRKTLSDKWQGG